MTWVVGIDIGGSGSRAVLAGPGSASRLLEGERARIAEGGSSIAGVAADLLRRVAHDWPAESAQLSGIAVGATGLATLVADPRDAVDALAALNPAVPIALATDAVTTHLGALGGEGGAVVAVGTGSIAFATDLDRIWHRVDGWGHLLGDRGAGAWIGMEGLRAAARAHDGVDRLAVPLLAAARERFGDPQTWPAQFYTRQDRAGVLAGFAPAVAALAADDDAPATAIMRGAGEQVARSLSAALIDGVPGLASTSGGVFDAGGVFVEAFRTEFARLRPDVDLREPLGSSLDGAVRLARRLGESADLDGREPHIWVSGR